MNHRGMQNIGPWFSTDDPSEVPGYGASHGLGAYGSMGQTTAWPGFPGLPGVPGFPAIPGLPSTGIPGLPDATPLLEGLPTLGLYTTWAAQTGDAAWQDLFAGGRVPEWNIAAFPLDQVQMQLAAMSLGRPGWVAVITSTPATLGRMEHEFKGTPYEFFSGHAVYRQQDPSPVPRMQFLYWGRLREPGDPNAGNASVLDIASRVGGFTAWGQQLMYGDTVQRRPPSSSFEEAYTQQFGAKPVLPGEPGPPLPGEPGPPPPPAPAPPPPPESKKASMGAMLAVGGLAAVAGFLGARALRKKG